MSLLSSLYSYAAEKLKSLILTILAAGPIPKHVAFIMDGNRRYARSHNIRVPLGHESGFMALRQVLEVCLRLNIRCVSVYAFAIENFKRPEDEIDALMDLAEHRLVELCSHGDLLEQYGVRLNVVGCTSLLPERVQVVIRKAEKMTQDGDKAILNLCMPYASRDEIATAVESAINSVDGDPRPTITEDMIHAHLPSVQAGSPPLDILVRTSGVKRLSDYMLWQCCENTQIHFSSVYWPDYGLWDFLPVLLDYQRKVWCM
ncbi:Di-trans-poly-cis-decaprenylcistransferase [Fistulina hepatica ATCC 64428]|uniref:Alkyl transferase n=1 Tax=Fistulina hepatica ATCC 64428 TaxID=1128425 RepID=A0A0D7AEV7_9AGAR|nr:Di-trans-poly-cis-decaprenylcistransferase [Fistulina hepatica ATCC 64428]